MVLKIKNVAPDLVRHFLWSFTLTLPGKISVNSEDSEQNDFATQHRLQGFEKVCFEIVNRHDKAHMRGCEHLPGYAEGHGYAGKV